MAKKRRKIQIVDMTDPATAALIVNRYKGKFLVGQPPGMKRNGKPTTEMRAYRQQVRHMIAHACGRIDFEHLYQENPALFVRELLPYVLGRPKTDIDLNIDSPALKLQRKNAEELILKLLGKGAKS